jgi:hypothetical protein
MYKPPKGDRILWSQLTEYNYMHHCRIEKNIAVIVIQFLSSSSWGFITFIGIMFSYCTIVHHSFIQFINFL